MTDLKGKTLFITGASRGIGLAIAARAARDGARIAIVSKTTEPHPKLPGTIYTAADAIETAGGKALPLACDIRQPEQVREAVATTIEVFGGIDILVNNASAIRLTGTLDTPVKRFDLMHQVNARGTFVCSKYCIPHLQKAKNPHILNISPPLDMAPKWFGPHVAYTMTKFGMSMCTLGMAAELEADGIAVNSLWPRTGIATAAIQMLGGDALMRRSRKPEIMADAAHVILTKPSRDFSGHFCLDDLVLAETGVRDFDAYAVDPSMELFPDFFVPDDMPPPEIP